jgi:raffinose/stachyose/melibiose transport system permease protein
MKSEQNLGTRLLTIVKWFILLFFLLVALLPLVWLFINSFRSNLELQISSFGWPQKWLFSNYIKAMEMASLPRLFLNSVVASSSAVALNILVAAMAGFILSREFFKGRDTIYTVLTAGVLVPIIAFMVPYFSLISRSGLYNTLFALILVYASVNIPVSIFLVTSFMRSIPKELEEAAIIDGCSFTQRFTKIIFPLTQSGLVTAGTFCFIYSWNDFIMAMLLTSSIESRTIQLGIKFFSSQFITDYTTMFAAIILTIIPSVGAYMFLHNKIISGLTAGAVKG